MVKKQLLLDLVFVMALIRNYITSIVVSMSLYKVTGKRDGTFLYWQNTLYNRFNNPVTPVALDDRINLTTGDSTTIDILSNDGDRDGGNIELTDYDPTTEEVR